MPRWESERTQERERPNDRETGGDRGSRNDGPRHEGRRPSYDNRGGGRKRGRDEYGGRDDYRGGGGYKEPRRYSDHSRGPPMPRQQSPPRQEPAPKSVDQMLTELLLEIGNPADGPLAGNLEELSMVLQQDLGDSQALILQLILDCVVELPAQTPVYGTLAGLLNASITDGTANSCFGAAIVAACQERFQTALDEGNNLHARLLLRFLSELVNTNTLDPDSLLQLFTALVESAIASANEASAPCLRVLKARTALHLTLCCAHAGGGPIAAAQLPGRHCSRGTYLVRQQAGFLPLAAYEDVAQFRHAISFLPSCRRPFRG